MRLNGKVLTVALGAAALSGTTAVPATYLLASPLADAAAVEAITPVPVMPAPAAIVAPAEPAAPAPATAAAPEPESATEVNPAADAAKPAISARELECLTKVILYESGSESRAGQLAVAQVVMNRVKSPRFPNSVCGVIYQRGQFSSIRSFRHAKNARWNRAAAIARDVMAGEEKSVVGRALYFHATRVRPAYVRNHTRVATIGNHVFYR